MDFERRGDVGYGVSPSKRTGLRVPCLVVDPQTLDPVELPSHSAYGAMNPINVDPDVAIGLDEHQHFIGCSEQQARKHAETGAARQENGLVGPAQSKESLPKVHTRHSVPMPANTICSAGYEIVDT